METINFENVPNCYQNCTNARRGLISNDNLTFWAKLVCPYKGVPLGKVINRICKLLVNFRNKEFDYPKGWPTYKW